MKITFFLRVLGVCILFLSLFLFCNPQEEKTLLPHLVRAEALMYTHPDSALHLLETMEMPPSTDKLQNATWCLFMTQARDKNYMKHTSDSLINIAYNYFMKQNDPQRKAMVLYYEGTIHLNMYANTEKATLFYLDASQEVEKTKDYQLAYLINVNLGNIYTYRDMTEYGMQAFKRANEYAKRSNNQAHIAYSWCYIARIYALKANWEQAISHYEKALHIAKSTDNQKAISTIKSELSSIYNRAEKYTLALEYAKEALKIQRKEQLENKATLLTIGNIYRKIGNADSASYFLNKATLSDNSYTCQAAYQALCYLHQDVTKDYKKALAYSEKRWVYTDSIQKIDKSKELIKMREMFNQEKILNEKNQLQIENDYITRNSLLMMIVLLCLLTFIIYVYQRKLIRKERTIQKGEVQMRSYKIKIHENESMIDRNEYRIKDLCAQMEINQEVEEQLKEQQTVLANIQQQNNTLKQENTSLQEKIVQHGSSLQEKDKIINVLKVIREENQRLCSREKLLSQQLFTKAKAFKYLKQSPQHLNATQWHETVQMIDEIHNNFTQRLKKQIPTLTESELQLSCLIKLGLSISEVAILLNISATSVSTKKLRLKARIIETLHSPFEKDQTLDLWMGEY